MAWTFVSLHAMKPARSRGRRRWDARNLISTQVSPELSPVAVEANAQKLVTLLAVLGFSIDSVAERRGNKLLVTFIGAANCWGLRSLSQGNPLARPPLVNDFGAKVRRLYGNQNLTACSPRNDFVKNYRVHPTHWLIPTQALTASGPNTRNASSRIFIELSILCLNGSSL